MKCLFVGGDYDGEWREVDTGQTQIMLPSKMSFEQAAKFTAVGTTPFIRQSYKRELFTDVDRQTYYVYFGGGNINAPMKRLIDGYKALTHQPNEQEQR